MTTIPNKRMTVGIMAQKFNTPHSQRKKKMLQQAFVYGFYVFHKHLSIPEREDCKSPELGKFKCQ